MPKWTITEEVLRAVRRNPIVAPDKNTRFGNLGAIFMKQIQQARLSGAILLLLSTTQATASELCSDRERLFRGTWDHGSQEEVLDFRVGLMAAGSACYATLNAYEPWGAKGPTEFAAEVRSAQDPIHLSFGNGWAVLLHDGGDAEFIAGDQRAQGRWWAE